MLSNATVAPTSASISTPVCAICLRRALHLCALVRSDDVDLNFAERQSVAQRNELRRLLRSLDAGNPRRRETLPFAI